MAGKKFFTNVVVTAFSGTAYPYPDGGLMMWSDLQKFLGFMVNDEDVYTHDMVRIADIVKPYLAEQFIWLSELKHPDFSKEKPEENEFKGIVFIQDVFDKYGEQLNVHPMPAEDFTVLPPEVTAAMAMPNAVIISVDENFNILPPIDEDTVRWNLVENGADGCVLTPHQIEEAFDDWYEFDENDVTDDDIKFVDDDFEDDIDDSSWQD